MVAVTTERLDFGWNGPTGYDAGTLSSTQTETENYLIQGLGLGLAPSLCDRVSGGSRIAGWTDDVSGLGGSITDTAGTPNYVRIAGDVWWYTHFQRAWATDNITIIGRIYISGIVGNSLFPKVWMYWDTSNWWGCGSGADNATANVNWECVHAVAGAWGAAQVAGASATTWYYYRIVLSAANVTCAYSTDGVTWTQIQAWGSRPAGFANAPAMIGYGNGISLPPTYPNADLDNNAGTSGTTRNQDVTDMTILPYATSGDWTSPTITIPSNKEIFKINLLVASADANNYVDKVEILKASDSSVLSTYTGNITSNGKTILSASNFDNGFSVTKGIDSQLKVYLVGQGTSTITIFEITGTLKTVDIPIIRGCL